MLQKNKNGTESYIGTICEDTDIPLITGEMYKELVNSQPISLAKDIKLPDDGYWAMATDYYKHCKPKSKECISSDNDKNEVITVFTRINDSKKWIARTWGFSSIKSACAVKTASESARKVLENKSGETNEGIPRFYYNTRYLIHLVVGLACVGVGVDAIIPSLIENELISIPLAILLFVFGALLSVRALVAFLISPLRKRFLSTFSSKFTPATLIKSIKKKEVKKKKKVKHRNWIKLVKILFHFNFHFHFEAGGGEIKKCSNITL